MGISKTIKNERDFAYDMLHTYVLVIMAFINLKYLYWYLRHLKKWILSTHTYRFSFFWAFFIIFQTALT